MIVNQSTYGERSMLSMIIYDVIYIYIRGRPPLLKIISKKSQGFIVSGDAVRIFVPFVNAHFEA